MSFSNNFDTPSVIKALLELVSFTNSKLDLVSACTLYQVRDFVKRILDILGINKEEKVRDEDSENLAKLINIFRNKIRMALKEGVNKKDLYNICDEVRDNLKDLGYVLEDSKLETLIKKL